MRTLLAPCLLVALLLAGCSTAPTAAPADHATTSATHAATTTGSAPAPRAVKWTSTPFTLDGQTATGGCAFAAVVGYCDFPAGHDSFKVLDAPGAATALHANVTWTPTVPAQPELVVYLEHAEGKAWYWRTGDPVASGPSPLRIDWPLNGTASTYAISVDYGDYEGAGDAGAVVAMPQDFHVEGAVVSQS